MTRWTKAMALGCVLFVAGGVKGAAAEDDVRKHGGLGGRLDGDSTIFLVNPCNGENVTGPLRFSVTVAIHGDDDHGNVDVSTRYDSISTGDQTGKSYEVKGRAHAAYDTLGFHYLLPMELKVKGRDGAPSFTVLTDTFVPVDDHQRPLNLPSVGIGATCTP